MGIFQWISDNISFILIAIGLTLVPGIAAISKGKSFWLYFLISCFITPVISFIVVLCKKGEWQQFIEEKATHELEKSNNESQKREGNMIVKILIWILCILFFVGIRFAIFFAVKSNLNMSNIYDLNAWTLNILFIYFGCIIARHICYHMDIRWIKKYTRVLG